MTNTFKKTFSPSDFAASDKLAKDATIKFLEQNIPGSRVMNNMHNEFGVDLFLMLPVADEENLYSQIPLEVEHRRSWKNKDWKFGDRMRIPGRKLKLQGASYMVLNNDCTAAIYIPGTAQSHITFVATRYSSTEEMFICYSMQDCTMLDLQSSEIQPIKF